MELSELIPIIESVIFVSAEPIKSGELQRIFTEEEATKEQITEAIEKIKTDWNDDPSRGVSLIEVAGGYQFRTKVANADYIKRMAVPKPVRLSAPALETLAIIAYRQPIVRSEIEQIRGVDSGGVIKTLLERNLVRIVGKREEAGNPLIYGTSSDFLKLFNLKGLRDLPTLKDLNDLNQQSLNLENPVSDEVAESEENFDLKSVYKDVPMNDIIEAEKKDREVIDELEESLKDLRHIEKVMFPKPQLEVPQMLGEEGVQGETQGEIESPKETNDGEAGEQALSHEATEAPGPDDEALTSGS
ncbi:MAG: SMC-Scp complex subunit ScpB [Pseudomonadota bacterium]